MFDNNERTKMKRIVCCPVLLSSGYDEVCGSGSMSKSDSKRRATCLLWPTAIRTSLSPLSSLSTSNTDWGAFSNRRWIIGDAVLL